MSKRAMDIKERINLAKDWLLDSGIQNLNGQSEKGSGGFNAWYDPASKRYSYVYSEISGYGITALLFLNKLSADERLVGRAEASADWLIDRAMSAHKAVWARDYYDPNAPQIAAGGWIYAFDNGMVLYGLANLYKVTGKEKYLDCAKGIADFLLTTLKQKDGRLAAYYVPSEDKAYDTDAKWSTQSGSYHAKAAMGLLELGRITKAKRYTDAALELCEAALGYYENGRFVTDRKSRSTHLHPHCYSAEGLLFVGSSLDREELVAHARDAARWALDAQGEDGGIPTLFLDGGKISHQRSDILAQVLRLGSIFYFMNAIEEKYLEKLGRLARRLLEFQNLSDGGQKGGFFFGYDEDGSKRWHLNSWCSMFALQALWHYTCALESKKPTVDLLV